MGIRTPNKSHVWHHDAAGVRAFVEMSPHRPWHGWEYIKYSSLLNAWRSQATATPYALDLRRSVGRLHAMRAPASTMAATRRAATRAASSSQHERGGARLPRKMRRAVIKAALGGAACRVANAGCGSDAQVLRPT